MSSPSPRPPAGFATSERFVYARNWDRFLVYVPRKDLFFKANEYELLALQFIKTNPGIALDGLVELYARFFNDVRADVAAEILGQYERMGMVGNGGPAGQPLACDESWVWSILAQAAEMRGQPERNYCETPPFVSIDVTDHCNLRCKHCRTDASRFKQAFLSKEVIFRLLDELNEMGVFSIQFSGGEPFIRDDMGEILRHARGLNLNWMLKVASNGTLITDEIARLLKEVGIDLVSVSIDGLGEVHDRFRQVDSSFDRAVEGIRRLVARDLYVLVNTVIHRGNIDQFEEIARYVRDQVGPSGHRFSIIFPAGRGETDPREFFSLNERQSIWQRYLRLKATCPTIKMRMPYMDYALEEDGRPGFEYLKGCVAGKSFCAIQACGDVSPCKLSLDHVAGNIYRQPLREIWGEAGFSPFREFEGADVADTKCRECRFLSHCRGGCRIVAQRLTGDFFAKDPWCELPV